MSAIIYQMLALILMPFAVAMLLVYVWATKRMGWKRVLAVGYKPGSPKLHFKWVKAQAKEDGKPFVEIGDRDIYLPPGGAVPHRFGSAFVYNPETGVPYVVEVRPLTDQPGNGLGTSEAPAKLIHIDGTRMRGFRKDRRMERVTSVSTDAMDAKQKIVMTLGILAFAALLITLYLVYQIFGILGGATGATGNPGVTGGVGP